MQLSVAFLFLELVSQASSLHVSPASCSEAGSMSFSRFVKKYGRTYELGTAEYAERKDVFDQHSRAIATHNCGPLSKQWSVAVNHMADWTTAELKALNGYRHGAHPSGALALNRGNASRVNIGSANEERWKEPLPAQAGWDHLHSVKDIRDQGSCGSCWAFSAVSTMDAQFEIATGTYNKLSVSQLLYCTPNPRHCGGTGGCGGATNELAYDYALKVQPVRDAEYPEFHKSCGRGMSASNDPTAASFDSQGSEFHGVSASRVTADMAHRGTRITGWSKLPENHQAALMHTVVNFGPVGVAVSPGYFWSFYNGGIMSSEGCDPDHVISHAVVLVGYGESTNTKYWHIKNSWGGSWGERGLLRLVRTDHEEQECGWDNKPKDGNGCDGGPPRVHVCGTCGILFDTSFPVYSK